jgi:phosphoglycolate phosphatase
MARRFELIVFDWDGTLMDSAGAIVGSIMAACADLGIAPPPEERARHIIGLGLRDALLGAVPHLPADRYPEIAERYRFHYLRCDQELRLFAGVADLLQTLAGRGHRLAVATGKSRQGLQRAMSVSGLAGFFAATRCADECHSKPHPQMLDELMQNFAVRPEATLMIGDTTHDLQMAGNAGVAAVAVAYGAHPRSGLEAETPLFCAASVEELRDWLLANA